MMDCKLAQLPDGWWCPACDPSKARILPVQARRTCRALSPPDLKESRKAACEGCEWLSKGRCLAQVKANCPNQTAPRVDEIAGHLGATCPEGRWPLPVVPPGEDASDGCKTVDKSEYERRLTICDGCDMRAGNRCSSCGCNLALKARGRAFRCPLGKWGDQLPSRPG